MKLYFAYGSNLCVRRLKHPTRVPSASFNCLATLEDHRVVFQKRSIDGSGKATIIRDLTSQVIGALFTYEDQDHERLKKAEAGYDERLITVSTPEGEKEVQTFICAAEKLDSNLQPYDWYLDLIRQGGQSLGLPESYLSQFDTVAAIADPDSNRRAQERAFLE